MVNLVFSRETMNFAASRGNGVIKAHEIEQLFEADSIIAAAQNASAQIKENAQAEYELEKARGYDDGRKRANEEALTRLLGEQVWLDRKLQVMEQELANIVKITLRTIIGTVDDESLVEAMVSVAMRKMRRQQHLQIHLPPRLLDTFLPAATRLEALFPHVHSVELVPDVNLQVPDFIVESASGRIECKFGDMLEEVDDLIDSVFTAYREQTVDPDWESI